MISQSSQWASLGAQLVKNPPAVREAWVPSLGWEDPLEKGKATHSSILAWRIPWTIQSMRSQSQTGLSDFHIHFPLFRVPNTAHRNNPKPLCFALVYSPVSLRLLLSIGHVSSSVHGGAVEGR